MGKTPSLQRGEEDMTMSNFHNCICLSCGVASTTTREGPFLCRKCRKSYNVVGGNLQIRESARGWIPECPVDQSDRTAWACANLTHPPTTNHNESENSMALASAPVD
jgi:hypothetical protein